MFYKYFPNHKFQSNLLYGQPLQVTNNFETSALKEPHMALNTMKWKVPHMYGTTIPKSQISIGLAVQPAVFELPTI